MNLKDEIQSAIDEAHAISEKMGASSKESAVAWDTVEELQAEAAHQQANHPKTAFEDYCNENPDTVEARTYDD